MKLILEFNETEMIKALSDPFFMSLLSRIRNIDEKQSEKIHNKSGTKHKADNQSIKTSPLKGKPAATCAQKICPQCNNSFKPDSNAQVYCSTKCRQAAREKAPSKHQDLSRPDAIHESPGNNQEPSFYKKKLEEERKAKEEAKLMESFRDHPKLDLKKINKEKQIPVERIEI